MLNEGTQLREGNQTPSHMCWKHRISVAALVKACFYSVIVHLTVDMNVQQ